MNDLISRESVLKNIEKIRQSVQMMDDTHRASITMSGMYLCEKAVRNQPSEQPDLCDGCDRYGTSCVGEGCGKLEMPEIIRCCDCISYQEGIDIDGKPFTRCNGSVRTYGHTLPDWFCADAERRTDEPDKQTD